MGPDLDRLWNVLDGRVGGVGCGRTYAACQLAVGALGVGEKHILFLVPEPEWVYHVSKMLTTILTEQGHEYRLIARGRYRVGDAEILITVPTPNTLAGRSHWATVTDGLGYPPFLGKDMKG